MHSLVYNLFVIIYTQNTNMRNQLKSKIYEYEILFLFYNNAMCHNNIKVKNMYNDTPIIVYVLINVQLSKTCICQLNRIEGIYV